MLWISPRASVLIRTFALCWIGGFACNGAQQSEAEVGAPVALHFIGSEGGQVRVTEVTSSIFGTTLTFPPGALVKRTDIGIAPASDRIKQGETALGPAVAVTADPDVQQFFVDTTLILPFDRTQWSDRDEVVVVQYKAQDRVATIRGGHLLVDEQAGLLRAPIRSPGVYQLVKTGHIKPFNSNKADILFVIDNSGSMAPKQKSLATSLKPFFDQITGALSCIDYHIGVITTDVGSQTQMGAGDDGLLQNTLCIDRYPAGMAPAECKDVCTPAGALPPGKPMHKYLAKEDVAAGRITEGELINQFKCMAMVGNQGSQYESPLEAVRRAMDKMDSASMPNPMKPNAGFSRASGNPDDDSLLSLVFITDEDDSSIDGTDPTKLSSTKQAFLKSQRPGCNPASRSDGADPSCYPDGHSFRGLAVGLDCTDSLLLAGSKDCKERDSSMPLLGPVDRYAQLLINAKKHAQHILISGVWSLNPMDRAPETYYDFGKRRINFNIVSDPDFYARADKAFCVNKKDPSQFGYPQVRLSAFIDRMRQRISGISTDGPEPYYQESICEPADQWANTLGNLGAVMVDKANICKGKLTP